MVLTIVSKHVTEQNNNYPLGADGIPELDVSPLLLLVPKSRKSAASSDSTAVSPYLEKQKSFVETDTQESLSVGA
jgi:hypothetical protein